MATFKQVNGRWEAQIKKAGVRRSKTFATKTLAATWARRIESEIEQGIAQGGTKSATILFADMLRRYEREITPRKRSQRAERSRIQWLERRLGRLRMSDVTAEVLVEYVDERLRQVGVQQVKHELSTIRLVFDAAASIWGVLLPTNPVDRAKAMLRSTRTLSGLRERDRRPRPGELGAILAHLPGHMPELVCFAIETCMRRGELVRQRDEHRHGDVLEIAVTKTDRPRTIPLTPAAQGLLDGLPRNESGATWGLAPDSITGAWQRACRAATVKDLRFHDLRHEGTSRLFEGSTWGRSLSIPEAALITGHSTWSQLQRYTNLTARHVLSLSSASATDA